jgi:hypothetical protein
MGRPSINVHHCAEPPAPAVHIACVAQLVSLDQPAHEPKHLPGEPGFEHEVECEPAVCRWCKDKREITINFKTRPCDCVKQENTGCVGQEDIGSGWEVLLDAAQTQEKIGRGWKVKHEYRGLW